MTVSHADMKMSFMSILIDYTSRKFRHEDGHHCLLQFQCDRPSFGDPAVDNPLGQVIATVMNPGAPEDRRVYGISRPHIRFNDAERAVDRGHLPYLNPDLCDLRVIRDRLAAARLT